jgi:hypothetical protein
MVMISKIEKEFEKLSGRRSIFEVDFRIMIVR